MEHSHSDDEDKHLDPRIVGGWQALESGDLDAARAAAAAVLADFGGDADADVDVSKTNANKSKARVNPKTAPLADASRMDALLLMAACAREDDDAEAAMDSLAKAAKEDPEWCTPELWMAELLSEDPDQLDEALRHVRRALDRAEEEDEYLDAIKCKAAIELELGRPTEARKTLSGLPAADVLLDDPYATLDFAHLLMDTGDPAEARVRLQTLVDAAPELADAWYLLGAAAEMTNDEEAKRVAWIKTRTLDLTDVAPGGGATTSAANLTQTGPELTEETLVALAEETLAEMPEELRAHLTNVPILVAEVPAAEDVATGLDPRLLGLFSGTPHAESGGVLTAPSLTEIVLFRRNIERFAVDEEALRHEVRTTLLHEAGHFFGLDEEALARLGLE